MAATQAVLNTTELLENIILHQPPTAITSMNVVSKRWNILIKTSKRIHRAHILRPTQQEAIYDIPMYEKCSDLQVKPRFGKPDHNLRVKPRFGEPDHIPCRTYMELCLRITYGELTDCRSRECQFVTSPPCQAIAVQLIDFPNHICEECFVYAKEGVRIRNLLDVTESLVAQASTRHVHVKLLLGEMWESA